MCSHHLSATEAGLARAARLQTRTTNWWVEADAHPPTTPLVLRAAVPEDRHALARMLSELSPRSSFLRFFAGGFRVTDRVLEALLCIGVTGRAFVAVEGDRVVAHAMWAATRADDRRAEIAFVVAAHRRRRGLATRLTRLALADASGSGFIEVEATVLAENAPARRTVRRLLPHATSTQSHGEITYVATLDESDATGYNVCRPVLRSTPRAQHDRCSSTGSTSARPTTTSTGISARLN